MMSIILTKRKKIPRYGDDEPRSGRPCIYPWRQMEVGQSFFVPNVSKLPTYYWARKTGYRYLSRLLVEREQTGVRVWRIA